MKMKIFKKYYIYIIFMFIAIGICMRLTASPLFNYMGIDGSVFLYTARGITNGKIVYSQMFDHKGPLIYLINFIATIADNDFLGIWIIEIITLFIDMCLLYKISKIFIKGNKFKPFIATLISILPFITCIEEGNFTEEYAIPFILGALYLFIKIMKNDYNGKKKEFFLIGLFLGAVLMLRPNMIAVWAVYYIFYLIEFCKQKRIKEFFVKTVLYGALGMATAILPFFIYLICAGAFHDFVNEYIIFNFTYSEAKSYTYSTIARFFIKQNKVFLLAFIINLLYMFLAIKRCKEERKVIITSLIFSILSFLIVIQPCNPYLHYAMILIPCTIIPITLLIREIKYETVLIILLCITILIITNKEARIIKRELNSEYMNYNMKIVEQIENNTEYNDKISVLGNKCLIYLLSNREAATKYPYQFLIANIDKNILQEFIEQLEIEKPKMIINLMSEDGEFQTEMKKFLEEKVEIEEYKQINNIVYVICE